MPSTLLDVDEAIIKNNLLLPEFKQGDDELNRLLKDLETPQVPSIIVKPLPGLCLKTKTDKGEKIFINICHTSEIPPPEDITDERFHQILDEDSPSWAIPMSIGHERLEADKNGIKCPTYDVAINTKFFEKCQNKEEFFLFAVLTILSAVGNKYDKVLDSENYVIMKNKKIHGKLHDHRIQKREPKKAPTQAKPLIEEIVTKKSTSRKVEEEKNLLKKKTVVDESKYVILKTPKEGKADKLIGFFKLPVQSSTKNIRADVGEDRLVIEAPDYLVDLFLPFTIDQTKTTASLDPTLNILRLDMPVVSP